MPLQVEEKREAKDIPRISHSAGVSLEMGLLMVLGFGTEKGEVELGDSKLKIRGDEKEEKLQGTNEIQSGMR